MIISKIKVLEVIRQGQIGGGESHLLDLITFLDKKHLEPVCLSFTSGEMISRLQTMGICCHVIETQKPFDRNIQGQIVQLIRDEQIQLVLARRNAMRFSQDQVMAKWLNLFQSLVQL